MYGLRGNNGDLTVTLNVFLGKESAHCRLQFLHGDEVRVHRVESDVFGTHLSGSRDSPLILCCTANAHTSNLSREASLQIADHVGTDFATLVNLHRRRAVTVLVLFLLLVGGSRFHLCGEVVDPGIRKILQRLGLQGITQSHNRDHRGDTDDHAQQRQQRTHFVGAQAGQGEFYGFCEAHANTPSTMVTIRVVSSANSALWVMNTIVLPCSWLSW